MRRSALLILAVVAMLAAAGCQNDGPRLARSGNADVDQTARFLAYVIDEQRSIDRFEDSTALASWMTSTVGIAEWAPPNKEYEEDAAAMYHGPRPAQTVGIWKTPFETGAFKYYILISADSSKDMVVLRAFNMGESEPFYSWEL